MSEKHEFRHGCECEACQYEADTRFMEMARRDWLRKNRATKVQEAQSVPIGNGCEGGAQ